MFAQSRRLIVPVDQWASERAMFALFRASSKLPAQLADMCLQSILASWKGAVISTRVPAFNAEPVVEN